MNNPFFKNNGPFKLSELLKHNNAYPNLIKEIPKDENFIDDFKKLDIQKDQEILTMCMGGVRSQTAAELLTKEHYNCANISDGFLGNSANAGWKNSGLPCK